jgi:biopolymer transport protein TolR
MGMNVGTSGGRGRGRKGRSGGARPMAEINVTPLVDVMLVLLIIFMVAAPLLTAGVPVDLPKADAKAIQTQDEKPIELTVNADGQTFIGDTQVSMDRLLVVLSGVTHDDPEKRIFIRGDYKLSYGQIMRVIGILNKAGYRKVALITDSSSSAP